PEMQTITIRPAWTWGPGDRHLLPQIVKFVRQRGCAWLNGGRHQITTSHVDNVVQAMMLAIDRGTPASSYFVADDVEMPFRDFIGSLLSASGVATPTFSMPLRPAVLMSRVVEAIWRHLRSGHQPPLTLAACLFSGLGLTVDDSRARAELG